MLEFLILGLLLVIASISIMFNLKLITRLKETKKVKETLILKKPREHDEKLNTAVFDAYVLWKEVATAAYSDSRAERSWAAAMVRDIKSDDNR